MRNILPVLKKNIPEQNEEQTLLIMMYEIGDAVKCFVYKMRNPELQIAYNAEMKIALSDLLAQINIMCEIHNWDINDVLNLGLDRFTEKVIEYARNKQEKK